jgi:hypothetical protein
MSRRAAILAARRDLAVARSAYLRADLQCEAAALGRRLRFFDRATALARSGSGRVLLVSGAAVLLLVGPHRLLGLAGRVVAAWPLVRTWASAASAFMTAARPTRP